MTSAEAIQAYTKLDESAFFLEKLKEIRGTSIPENPEQNFYFSAFLHAWKGALDVLLYDFAIIYDLGFDRNDKMMPWQYLWAAKRLDDMNAMRFFKWWAQKKRELGKSSLWERRNSFTHRGYEHGDEFMYFGTPDYNVDFDMYGFSDFDDDSDVGQSLGDVDFESIILVCEGALKAAEEIVEDAESLFLIET
jgi:hypothetical protein